jgi:hypothetical protein
MSFTRSHQVLQVAFGWEDIHQHRFALKECSHPGPSDASGSPGPLEDSRGEEMLEVQVDPTHSGAPNVQNGWLADITNFDPPS